VLVRSQLRNTRYTANPLTDDVIAEQQQVGDFLFSQGVILKPVKIADAVFHPEKKRCGQEREFLMKVLWFLPTHGDGRYLGTATGGRVVDIDYLRQVAGAVDQLGYYGALLPTGRSCEDAWVTASALISATRKMRFLVAVRPGLIAPTLAARMAATFDRFSNGRLLNQCGDGR